MKFDLLTATAGDVRIKYEEGSLTCVELVMMHLQHIHEYNKKGPCLRALLSVTPHDKLIERARFLDDERERGRARGPLHGITFMVKDSIATHPDLGLDTTAGSLALQQSKPKKSATIVDQLLAAGLILIGKGNLSELSHMRDAALPCGWSSVGGQTQSAYVSSKLNLNGLVLDHSSPAGSSSGCAVGISAGFALLSVAQETRGSLNVPASRAALYALKPTRGSIPTDGIIPISRHLDSPGCMARSPRDLACIIDIIMTKQDLYQSVYGSQPSRMDNLNGWKGLRIGFLDPHMWPLASSLCSLDKAVSNQMLSEYKSAILKLRSKGVLAITYIDLPFRSRMNEIDQGLDAIMIHDFRPDLEEYLDELEFSKVRTMESLIRWNDANYNPELSPEYHRQSTLHDALNDDTPDEEICETMSALQNLVGTEGVDLVTREHRLDAIGILMDSPICSIAAATGFPYCTMPLGYSKKNGRPFGIAMLAKSNNEEVLFQIMNAWEDTFPERRPPPLPKLYKHSKPKNRHEID